MGEVLHATLMSKSSEGAFLCIEAPGTYRVTSTKPNFSIDLSPFYEEDKVRMARASEVLMILEDRGFTVDLTASSDPFDIELNATRTDTGKVYLHFEYETVARVKQLLQAFFPD